MGGTNHGAFGYFRMAQQRSLNLDRRDLVTRADNQVIGTAVVPEVAVAIHAIGVAGQVPAALHIATLLIESVEVPASSRAADGQASYGVCRNFVAGVLDHLGFQARDHLAGCAGANLASCRGDEDVKHLGGTNTVDDLNPRSMTPGFEDR